MYSAKIYNTFTNVSGLNPSTMGNSSRMKNKTRMTSNRNLHNKELIDNRKRYWKNRALKATLGKVRKQPN